MDVVGRKSENIDLYPRKIGIPVSTVLCVRKSDGVAYCVSSTKETGDGHFRFDTEGRRRASFEGLPILVECLDPHSNRFGTGA